MKVLLQSVGDYQVLERLGRGGMADVYLALDTRSNRKVALKLVEHGQGEEVQEVLAAERLGAQLQAHLCAADERIPQIHTYGDIDGFFCIDMEYIEGRDLSECIRSGSLDVREASRIATELCSILAVAHNTTLEIGGRELRAIVHGDIKPKNVRIDAAGRVRVLDFGIAKGLSLTRKLTSNYFGSVAYSSPERLETGQIDETSDLWAVGVVLYEMIGGQAPFEAPSTESLERVVRSRVPPRPLPADCPSELQQVVFKALAQSPGRRYPTAKDFESDLTAFLAGQTTVAARENEETRRSDPVGANEAPARLPPATTGGVETRRTRTGQKWRIVAKTLLKVGLPILLAGLGIWEAVVCRSASRLQPAFAAQQVDADRAWEQYQEIRRASPLGIAPLFLRGPLMRLLLEHGRRVADEYRSSDIPRTREGDWERARRYMTYARRLDASDKKAAAMFEYADGHILRINKKDAEAVSAFRRAASLNPRWPDPHLGMARAYIYGLKDFESGVRALERAEDLGHTPGKRELLQRADALKNKAIEYWQGAAQLRGQPQEEELLAKAKDDLERALEIYARIAPWGDSAPQVKSVQAMLDKIESRLEVIDPPESILPWEWWKRMKKK